MYPRSFVQPGGFSGGVCYAGVAPTSYEELPAGAPAIKDLFVDPFSSHNDNPDQGGPDPDETGTYVLIRKNIPTLETDTKDGSGWTFLGGTVGTTRTHTIKVGELPQKPGYTAYYPSKWGEIDLPSGGPTKTVYIRAEGLIVFISNDPSTVTRDQNGNNVFMADVYQDKRIYDKPDKIYQIQDLFRCAPNSQLKAGSVMIPPQNPSKDNQQLQLEWFAFAQNGVWGVHCKPAIYLFPPEKMLVNVKITPLGSLIYTLPQYDFKTGWTVDAYPDGTITTNYNRQPSNYPYLYYESKIRDEAIEKPTKGWVVKSEMSNAWFNPLEQKFNDILPKLGLNTQQTKDFIEYWKRALPYSPYYFIGVINQANINSFEKLQITPPPDSLNRVRIYFERLDQPKTVDAPVFSASPFTLNTSHFSVVEWGGMVKRDPTHPFTCSE